MWAWVKGFPIGHYIIMAAIGVAMWVYGDLTLTKQALEDQRELTAQWQATAQTLAAIDQRETIIIRASDEAGQAIRETENANAPISPDVAAAWAAGLDSVCNAAITDTSIEPIVCGPMATEAKPRGLDGRAASRPFKKARDRVLEL